MALIRRRTPPITSPKVSILNLVGHEADGVVASDAVFLRELFGELGSAVSPPCDVLLLYAAVNPDGTLEGSSANLREIIRDSGAKIIVAAFPNPGPSYVKAGSRQKYGQANLVMTIDRRGEAFGKFFCALFEKMKQGISMPMAWVELNPQLPGRAQPENPATIFACELGQVAFA